MEDIFPPGNLIGCGIKHLGDAAGYPFSVMRRGLSGSSLLKGLIDKLARGDTPIAQFDEPDAIPLRVFQNMGSGEESGALS